MAPGSIAPSTANTLNEAEELRAQIAAMQAAIDAKQRQQKQLLTAAPATAAAAAMRPASRAAGTKPPNPQPGKAPPHLAGDFLDIAVV